MFSPFSKASGIYTRVMFAIPDTSSSEVHAHIFYAWLRFFPVTLYAAIYTNASVGYTESEICVVIIKRDWIIACPHVTTVILHASCTTRQLYHTPAAPHASCTTRQLYHTPAAPHASYTTRQLYYTPAALHASYTTLLYNPINIRSKIICISSFEH